MRSRPRSFVNEAIEMDFCPKCGTRLLVKRAEEGITLFCPRCKYVKPGKESSVLSIVEKEATGESIMILDTSTESLQTLPTTETDCPKCGYKEAFWWIVQTRGADESPTQFFRCKRCNYVWREYS